MTFCIALKCDDGLIALADTQIVRGSEQLTKGKIRHLGGDNDRFFVMMSGLRSVRDKLVIYVDEAIATQFDDVDSIGSGDGDGDGHGGSERVPSGSEPSPTRLYQVANLLGEQLRRIRAEDGEALKASGLAFNAHAIIGGRLSDDDEPSLFYLYPEGNWIEVSTDTPWFMIGRTYYGRPILDRLMRSDVSLSRAAALALLAFDATQQSVTDVDFPIDMLALSRDAGHLAEHRFERHELDRALADWQAELAAALERLPMTWADALLGDGPATSANRDGADR